MISVLVESAGIGLTLFGGVWLIVLAFRTSLVWGLACLVLPLLIVPFGLLHLRRAGMALGMWCGGVGLYLVNDIVIQGSEWSAL